MQLNDEDHLQARDTQCSGSIRARIRFSKCVLDEEIEYTSCSSTYRVQDFRRLLFHSNTLKNFVNFPKHVVIYPRTPVVRYRWRRGACSPQLCCAPDCTWFPLNSYFSQKIWKKNLKIQKTKKSLGKKKKLIYWHCCLRRVSTCNLLFYDFLVACVVVSVCLT